MDQHNCTEGKIIIVEGIISSGKSLFCNSYAACNKNVVVFKEWVDNKILAEYISDMPNKATSFQFRAQEETLSKLLQAEILAKEGKIVLIDRGVYGNLIFATLQKEKGYISLEDFKEYNSKFIDEWLKRKSTSTITIETWLLKCDPRTAFNRINKRGREGESNYMLDYLIELDQKHQQMIPCDRVIDTNTNYTTDTNGNLSETIIRHLCCIKN